ncbi:wax ester/triacylglycerol synthase family O-acyltransferase [Dietzia sp. PP-33]|jgi:diacylglycerol O-acyltransferase|uniref:WS/DGAT/MGAT family O-acyltransferase n=1 Tax=Dietzia sp. PP-33 TaxID=2957500 RepID=UPI0029A9CBE5|nr:wax ester/triacylglycerol synthase family O-acyltransferase [Dietzia sp. PP-33]MDX2356777.1 wax ester/triacylglycerol synthase family O-acyltransferase [Dietzia sp. PP-33]
MERMTGLDASFLYMETDEQMMVINGVVHLDVSTIDEGYSFERLRSGLARRVKAVPPFRRKVHDSPWNLGHPAWVEDFDFDIAHHVRRIELGPGETEEEMLAVCGRLASTPLDRSRPLWQVWIIERGDPSTPTVTAFCRVHHAVIDGMLGAELLSTLAATDASTPEQDPALVRTHVGRANTLQLVAGGARELLGRPLTFLRLLPETVSVPGAMKRARGGATGAESMPAPFTAPRTLFNRSLTPHRAVATASLDLEAAALVTSRLGGTVNDVLLTVVGSAVRSYLEVHDNVPGSPLVAIVPMSTREDLTTGGANQVSAMFASLATDEPDPVERYRRISAAAETTKRQAGTVRPALLANWARMSPRWLLDVGMRAYETFRLADVHPVIYNLIISNVPGPRHSLYFLGARITHMHPFGPLLHGAGLSVTSVSVNGRLDVGVVSCEHLVPDPDVVADGIEAALDELVELTAP